MKITPANWPSAARDLAYPHDPETFSEDVIKAFIKGMGARFYKVPLIPNEFKSRNSVEIVEFDNDDDRLYYQSALERYEREINRPTAESYVFLVEDLKLRQAAEELKGRMIGNRMYNRVQEGFSAVAGVCFKTTVVDIVNQLVHVRKVDPKDITIIWGGYGAEERKLRQAEELLRGKMTQEEINDFIKEGAFEELVQMAASNVKRDLSAIDKDLLGVVKYSTRWEHICKFQRNEAKYAIFTFATGGVALSLHDESGLHPRVADHGLPYSERMTVQAYGRAHRLTSRSHTRQYSLAFNDSREIRVAKRVSWKLRSARHASNVCINDILFTDDRNNINSALETINPQEIIEGDDFNE